MWTLTITSGKYKGRIINNIRDPIEVYDFCDKHGIRLKDADGSLHEAALKQQAEALREKEVLNA